MKIDVRFIHGRQVITVDHITVVGDEAVRFAVTHRQSLFVVLLWRMQSGNLIVALLPSSRKNAWRWSGVVRHRRGWQKLSPANGSSPGRWICEVRPSTT